MENEEENNIAEEQDDHAENGRRKQTAPVLTVVFASLFFLAAGLLVYYQFYQGYGKWHFTLLHKYNDTSFLSQLRKKVPDTSKKAWPAPAKKDTSAIVKDTLVPKDSAAAEALKGTVYEVQIGAIEKYDLKKYNAVFNNLHEETHGSKTFLTLGRFRDAVQANQFKQDMVDLGIKGAWVVKKVDGKRVE